MRQDCEPDENPGMNTATVGDQFVAALTKPQRKLFDQLKELLARRKSGLVVYHDAGRKLAEFQDAGEKSAGWLQMLAEVLGLSASNLTKMRQFAKDFTRNEAERLGAQGCNWGMVTVALHAGCTQKQPGPTALKELRQDLLVEAVNKGWNLAELKDEIKKRYGTEHAGGRPLRAPQSCEARLRRLDALGSNWLRYYREVWCSGGDSAGEPSAALKRSERTALEELLPQVEQTLRAMKQALGGVDKSLGELKRKLKR
jgi:hypothetical protein